MKSTLFACALLISGTMLICEYESYLPMIGIGFILLSFTIRLWKPIARLGNRIARYYSQNDQNQE